MSVAILGPAIEFKRIPIANLSHNATDSNFLICYTSISTHRTVTLPTAVDRAGRAFWIIDESGSVSGSATIIVATTSSQTIGGAASKTINTARGCLAVYSDGANWHVLFERGTA